MKEKILGIDVSSLNYEELTSSLIRDIEEKEKLLLLRLIQRKL